MPKNASVERIIEFSENRELFIWGAMIVGQGVCRALERNGLQPRAFVDKSAALQGSTALGYEIQAPENALSAALEGTAGIVIGSGHHDQEIADICLREGLKEGQDFFLSKHLCDIDPSVDIAGACNLRCISCPSGNLRPLHKGGLMAANTYQKVLNKLVAEIPFMGSIQLYAWGEPLLNPQLPEIIRMTRKTKVLSAISTNLNTTQNFSEVIAAKPDWLKVSVSGYGPNYEITHTGGSWELLYDNLHQLKMFRQLYHPEMHVVVNYHIYKRNINEEYDQMRLLCKELGFVFRPNQAYLYPMDNMMDYVEGRQLSANAEKTLDMLMMDIDTGLARAREKKEMSCPEKRCFPINWDLRVRHCGVYYRPFIESNFLETTVEQVLNKRISCGFCRKCQSMALHQFTSVYLEETACRESDFICKEDARKLC